MSAREDASVPRTAPVRRLLAQASATLRQRRSVFLQANGAAFLRRILVACQAAGVQPFLMYGTLLGFHREAGFIKSDSDIDLGLLANDLAQLSSLKRAMRDSGMPVKSEMIFENRLWEVTFLHPRADLWVDFSVIHFDQGKAISRCYWANNGDMESHFWSAHLFEAFATRTWCGAPVRIPLRTDAVLRDLYGEWRIPVSDFDYRKDSPNAVITTDVPSGWSGVQSMVQRGRRLPRIARLLAWRGD